MTESGPGGVRRRLVFFAAISAAALFLSCAKPFEVTVDRNNFGKALLCDKDSGGIYAIDARTREKLLFRKKPGRSEAEAASASVTPGSGPSGKKGNFLGTKPVFGALDLCLLRRGAFETLLPGFVSIDPLSARGLLESAPGELLRGDQNIGKIGLLLPVYKAGVASTDWAVYDPSERKLFTLGAPGERAAEVKETLKGGTGSGLYRGERERASVSPSWPVVATLSHGGKMALFSWPEGKKIHEAQGVHAFCFHPSLKTIYIGSDDGLAALAWEKSGRERIQKLARYPVRMIRISQKGSYLFCLGTGGIPKPAVIALNSSGLYRDEPLELGKKYGEAGDWVWLDDKTLLLAFSNPGGSYFWELNVKKGEFYETSLDTKKESMDVVAANAFASVVVSAPEEGSRELRFYDQATGKLLPVKGLPEASVIIP